MTLSYPAKFTPEPEGGFTVTFRDVPEAITCGDDYGEALVMAEDCLNVAISEFSLAEDRDVPKPSKARKGEVLVSPSLQYALKFMLYQAMRDDGVRPAELARRMNVDHKAVSARLLKPGYSASMRQIERAFEALGRKPAVSLTAG